MQRWLNLAAGRRPIERIGFLVAAVSMVAIFRWQYRYWQDPIETGAQVWRALWLDYDDGLRWQARGLALGLFSRIAAAPLWGWIQSREPRP